MTAPSHIKNTGGFTLVEIMIAVSLIGLLCAMSLPSLAKARVKTRATIQANDLRVLEDAFQLYAMENGNYPAVTWQVGQLPPGMAPYVRGNTFSQKPPGGQSYCWTCHIRPTGETDYGITIANPDLALMSLVDQIMDDGQPDSGKLQSMAPSYFYIVGQ